MMPLVPTEREGAVLVDVLVTPRSSRVRIGPVVENRLKIAITAPPADGEANAAVILALARALGVPKRAIAIVRGESSRRKTLRIVGVTVNQVAALA